MVSMDLIIQAAKILAVQITLMAHPMVNKLIIIKILEMIKILNPKNMNIEDWYRLKNF